jgi:hypothetical protein
MSIYDFTVRPEAAREEAIKLFISAIHAVPEIVKKELSGKEFAEFLIGGAQKIKEYVLPSEIYQIDERRKDSLGAT